jgi:hypothetical protein
MIYSFLSLCCSVDFGEMYLLRRGVLELFLFARGIPLGRLLKPRWVGEIYGNGSPSLVYCAIQSP